MMSLVKLIIESHKNTNYNLVKIKQSIDTYRHWEELSVCVCDIYAPHIHNGPCRNCWKYVRKSDQEVLKFVLENLDNLDSDSN